MSKEKKAPSAKQLAARQKFAEAAKARSKAKQETAQEPETTYSDADIAELIKQVRELKQQNQGFTQPQSTLQSNNGKLVGTVEKYVVDPKAYPDPTERLANEPRLQRFAFPLNYELVFKVGVSAYQTQDGINTREPRFTLQLIKIMMDEDTGEPSNMRAMLYQVIFHEDPQAALIVAQENGLSVNDANEAEFLNEMRYLRMRDWLFELPMFYPKAAQATKGKKEIVIGNRIVEVYEVNGENTQTIPFATLNSKL